ASSAQGGSNCCRVLASAAGPHSSEGNMGIDIEAGGRVKTKKRITTTGNPYIRLLCKLYKFLSRRTDSKFNKVIFKRLNMTKKNKPPLSISKLAKLMDGKDGKV
ncbi:unnamed protein product, partial [Prorocentrum cordatum]